MYISFFCRIFYQPYSCLSVHKGVYPSTYLGRGMCEQGVDRAVHTSPSSTPRDGHWRGWYTSYWNAFLVFLNPHHFSKIWGFGVSMGLLPRKRKFRKFHWKIGTSNENCHNFMQYFANFGKASSWASLRSRSHWALSNSISVSDVKNYIGFHWKFCLANANTR